MPGANGIVAANYLYNTAAKDGTALGFLYQTIAQDQVLLQSNVQYDATKFNWIGRITATAEMLYTWHRVPVRRIEDLASRETVLGIGGPAIATYARLLNSSTGARFKMVRGYKSTAEIHIAMERGEVEGAYSSLSTVRSGWNSWLPGQADQHPRPDDSRTPSRPRGRAGHRRARQNRRRSIGDGTSSPPAARSAARSWRHQAWLRPRCTCFVRHSKPR